MNQEFKPGILVKFLFRGDFPGYNPSQDTPRRIVVWFETITNEGGRNVLTKVFPLDSPLYGVYIEPWAPDDRPPQNIWHKVLIQDKIYLVEGRLIEAATNNNGSVK